MSSFKFAGRVLRWRSPENLQILTACPVTNSTPTCGPGAGLVRAPRPKPRSRPRSQGHPRTVTRAETCAEEGLVCLTHQQAATCVVMNSYNNTYS